MHQHLCILLLSLPMRTKLRENHSLVTGEAETTDLITRRLTGVALGKSSQEPVYIWDTYVFQHSTRFYQIPWGAMRQFRGALSHFRGPAYSQFGQSYQMAPSSLTQEC